MVAVTVLVLGQRSKEVILRATSRYHGYLQDIMSSNLREDPKSILFEAQSAIAQKNWARALDSFTRLLQVVPTAGHPLPLLSRCLCYLELNEVSKAVEDAERVLKLDDVQTPEEIIPGCYSTRVAAAVRLAKGSSLGM